MFYKLFFNTKFNLKITSQLELIFKIYMFTGIKFYIEAGT